VLRYDRKCAGPAVPAVPPASLRYPGGDPHRAASAAAGSSPWFHDPHLGPCFANNDARATGIADSTPIIDAIRYPDHVHLTNPPPAGAVASPPGAPSPTDQ